MGPSRRLVAVIVTVIVLQFLVPTVALFLPDRPHRLGWQMYSGLGESEIVVLDGDGSPVDVPWDEILGWGRRPELDWTKNLPEALCGYLELEELTVVVDADVRSVRC